MSGSSAEREPPAAETLADSAAEPRLAAVLRYGRTATAFRAVGADLAVWWPSGMDGLVAYSASAHAMVAAGEPVAPTESLVAVAERFVAFAKENGKRVSFFATEGRLASSSTLQRMLIGAQPVWNPQQWSAQMAAHRSLREQLRRARAKGVVIEPLSASALSAGETAKQVDTLVNRWRAARSMATMHFLVTVDLESGGAARRHFAAWQRQRLVALLSLAPVPARNGWLFEHLLRDPDAPNGTLEQLVDHAMRTIAAEGAVWATLGLAPLYGDITPTLKRIRTWSTPLFNFAGLSAFKQKLRPVSWEPVYLAWPTRMPAWSAVGDGLRAFAGGSLVRFGLRTLLRGPRPVLFALEWLLIPWTIALAALPTAPWFPGVAAHAAWVAFDGLLLVALRVLRMHALGAGRLQRNGAARLATMIAGAVTIDVLITWWQAWRWNVPTFVERTTTTLEWMVLLLACAAPALAAPVLWGAARRLRALARPSRLEPGSR